MGKLMQFNDAARAKINAVNTNSLHDFSFDRNKGASASEMGCARQTVENLKNPPVHSPKQLRVFERGHVYEIMVESYLVANGYRKVTPADFPAAVGPCFVGGVGNQLTLEHPTLPVGAHTDFVAKHHNGRMTVIETKTTDGIPSEPYGNYVEQLHLQMGLLHHKFPDADIRGSILVRDLNKGEEEEFDGYTFNQSVFDYLLKKSVHLGLAKQGKVVPQTQTGPLCGCCNHQSGCPAFAGASSIPAYILDIAENVERLASSKKEIEKEIDNLKNKLQEFTGARFRGEEEGITLTATTVAAGTTLNSDKVKSDHLEVFTACQTSVLDSDKVKSEYPDVFNACQVETRKGFTKIEVKRLLPKPAKVSKAPKADKADAPVAAAA